MTIDYPLKGTHVTFDYIFDFVRQLTFDLFLETTKKEGSQDFVQTPDDQDSFFFIQLHFLSSCSEGRIKPLFKSVTTFEDRGQKEVKKSPKFGQLVLKGSSCQE